MQALPGEVKNQIDRARDALIRLVPAVRGVYLHGSICLNDFVPGRSDVDLLVLSDAAMSRPQRIALADALLEWHGRPCPLELSVTRLEDAQRIPVLCQFHFSEMWAPRYAAHDEGNPLLEGAFPDDDMPCHIRLTRQSGMPLFGPPPEALLPEIDDAAFWCALTYDLDDLAPLDNPVYDALTLARVASFARTRRILTKCQAADWAAAEYPRFAPVLGEAVSAYRQNRPPEWDSAALANYRDFMLNLIRQGLK
ncbi:MAG: DUF4111 domain-containing protein [Clostridia bacterium]|nr:DUF4111 domain-containing protein [Clostridia bacterium]